MLRISTLLYVVLIFLTAPNAGAQTPPPARAAPVASAQKKPPATDAFRSAFDGYRRFDTELPLTDWRKLHDTVHARGGWRAYAQESAKANAAKPAEEGK